MPEYWFASEELMAAARGEARLRKEKSVPRLRVMRPGQPPPPARSAAWGSVAGAPSMRPLLWIEHAKHPKRQPMPMFTSAAAEHPEYVLVRPRRWSRVTQVMGPDEGILASTKSTRPLFLLYTRWTIAGADGQRQFVLRERLRDAIWRRTVGTIGGPPDDLGWAVVVLIAKGLSFFRNPCRLQIRRAGGERIGFVTFRCGLNRPRDDFCIYLDQDTTASDDHVLIPGIIAAMQRMR